MQGEIRRGSTPRLDFDAKELDLRLVSDLYVTFSQEGTAVVEKGLADVVLQEGHIVLQLQQADTLALAPGMVSVQTRILFMDGAAVASDRMVYRVMDALKEGVLSE